jgi:hypothetical protein
MGDRERKERRRKRDRGTPALAFLFALVMAWAAFLRPWVLDLGATLEERGMPLAGDETCPAAEAIGTRAIAIAAPADSVWPWIVQLGQDRGGFYSHRWIENLMGARMPDVRTRVPGWRERAVGDTIWLGDPARFGVRAAQIVARLEPGRTLATVSAYDAERLRAGGVAREGAWIFALRPVDSTASRLVVRSRGYTRPTWPERLFRHGLYEPGHFVMEWEMMRNIRRLAEGGSR